MVIHQAQMINGWFVFIPNYKHLFVHGKGMSHNNQACIQSESLQLFLTLSPFCTAFHLACPSKGPARLSHVCA